MKSSGARTVFMVFTASQPDGANNGDSIVDDRQHWIRRPLRREVCKRD